MLLFVSSLCLAQNDPNIISRTGSVSLQPEYQKWSFGNSRSFTQLGTTLSMYYPVSRSTSFTLDVGQEAYSGDVESVSGLTDIQLSGNQYIEDINAIFSLGLGMPIGKKELTPLQFSTIALTSNWLFDLEHPGLGAGPTIEPGVSWLIPATDDLVFGLSGSFQYKGKYKPLKGFPDYDPGDEFTLSCGVDIDISGQSNISADITFTGYGADKFSGQEIFQSGSTISGIARYELDLGENELQISAGYRSKGKSKTATSVGLVDEFGRIEPDRIDASVSYTAAFGRKFSSQFVVGLRAYDKTLAAFSKATLYGISALPTYHVTSSVSLTAKLQAEFGTVKNGNNVSGFEGRIGISATF